MYNPAPYFLDICINSITDSPLKSIFYILDWYQYSSFSLGKYIHCKDNLD